jgi:hypothetical protein
LIEKPETPLHRAPPIYQIATQHPRFAPIAGLQWIVAHVTGRGFAIDIKRRDFPEIETEQAPSRTPSTLARYPFGVQCHLMLEAQTAKMIED